MANPFLMADDDTDLNSNDPNSNPFLMQDAEDNSECVDNPFVGQINNPFADYGSNTDNTGNNINPYDSNNESARIQVMYNENGHSISLVNSHHTNSNNLDSAMSFFGTTITDDDVEDISVQKPVVLNIQHINNVESTYDEQAAYSSEEELGKVKHGPPPRPKPPSQTTQELILSVADQLDQTSSHLLGRLPVTRTPSPVSMRDLHTPSPTPDFGDLVDMSDDINQPSSLLSNVGSQQFGGNFLIESDSINTENPFITPISESSKNEPVRPPPPRPIPPKPAPPSRPLPPSNIHSHQTQQSTSNIQQTSMPPPPRPPPTTFHQPEEKDLFDLFGTVETVPKQPPVPKSNEDILSLFATPKPQSQTIVALSEQPDLLSGDILSMDDDINVPIGVPLMGESMIKPVVPSPPPPPVIPSNSTVPNLIDDENVLQQNINLTASAPISSEFNVQEDNKNTVEQTEPTQFLSQKPEDDMMNDITNTNNFQTNISDYTKPAQEKENILDESDNNETLSVNSTSTVQIDSTVPSLLADDTLFGNVRNIAEQSIDVIEQSEQMDTGVDFTMSTAQITPALSANPFASPESEEITDAPTILSSSIIIPTEQPVAISISETIHSNNIFEIEQPTSIQRNDEFDVFAARFESVKKDETPLLLDGFGSTNVLSNSSSTINDAWGNSDVTTNESDKGFGNEFGNDAEYDSFLAMSAPPAAEVPVYDRNDSHESDEVKEFNVVIRPKNVDGTIGLSTGTILAPPPKSPQNNSIYSGDSSPRVNPFDKGDDASFSDHLPPMTLPTQDLSPSLKRTDSQDTPQTPLFDDDVSQPLEDFPRILYTGDGWEIQLRQPNKKKITGQRFWKKIWMRLVCQGDNPVLQLFNSAKDKDPFQELPLQACYSVSEIGAQQYDQFGKIFTIKLQYIFYKERPGVRPGQVTKAERLTNKLSQFAAYAIQGDYQGVKEFGSDLKKLGLPVEHAPQVSQLFKIGSNSYEDLKQFSVSIEEYLFKLNVHRDRALTYKSEEVQLTAVDELYVEQNAEGHVLKQIARVRLFFLGFLSGMPTIELGVNDLWRQGKEVVGRHDIIPVVTEEWIRLEGVEFHFCVQQNEYERSRTIRFQPPDACYIELMRFRIRPPKNRELPLQLKATWCVTGNKVELRADVLVPGFASRKLGQIPCEDVAIRFPIPECWIYLFRVEKHFRYGSVKSAHRRTGKIKGIERILGTVDQLQESLIEVTSGQAKYEHHHRAIVWRCPRLPKEGQGAYTTHQLVVRMALTSYDQIPEQLAPYCYVEFTMPATQVSHVTVRSVSVQDSDSDDPPEKYVRYLARHEYRVGIEHTQGDTSNPYLAATSVTKTIKEEPVQQQQQVPLATSPMIGSDSDSDSN